MKKYLILLLSLLTLLLASCGNTYGLEYINVNYNNPENGVIDANGAEITIMVESTHSFQLASNSPDVSFFRNGVVTFSHDGMAIVESTHDVYVPANKSDVERAIVITASHQHNPKITSSIIFVQPAQEEQDEETPTPIE